MTDHGFTRQVQCQKRVSPLFSHSSVHREWGVRPRETPPPPTPRPRDGHWSRWYTSYWNACLFWPFFSQKLHEIEKKMDWERGSHPWCPLPLDHSMETCSYQKLPCQTDLSCQIKSVHNIFAFSQPELLSFCDVKPPYLSAHGTKLP